MDKQPILSICVPIYNRKSFLERMLSRFMEDRQLFQDDIQLYISDNCSTEDVKGVTDYFSSLGLNLEYHCNERNLGMDGNFINCFNHARGKYVWLLGSDDTPQRGFLYKLLEILSTKDYGLLHLSDRDVEKIGQMVEYNDGNKLLEDIYIWITFISGNIVKTDMLKDLDLYKYSGTIISQTPLYLYTVLKSDMNAILYWQYLETENDTKNNGGYNLFKVFVDNLYSIYQEFVDLGLLKHRSLEIIKKRSYKKWLIGFVINDLIKKKRLQKNIEFSNSWIIIRKHYAKYPYFYYYTLGRLIKDTICISKRY